MKLLSSVLVACGLVGASLAAPAPVPQPTIESPTRPRVGRLDIALDEAPLPLVPPTSLAEQLSRYASAALDRLPFLDVAISVTPVFAGNDDDAQIMTDVDGGLVVVGSEPSMRAIIWDPSSHTVYLDSMSGLSARLPMAILLISLWLLFACLYMGRSAETRQIDPESGSTRASEGRRLLCLRNLRMREGLVEKLGLDTEDDTTGYL